MSSATASSSAGRRRRGSPGSTVRPRAPAPRRGRPRRGHRVPAAQASEATSARARSADGEPSRASRCAWGHLRRRRPVELAARRGGPDTSCRLQSIMAMAEWPLAAGGGRTLGPCSPTRPRRPVPLADPHRPAALARTAPSPPSLCSPWHRPGRIPPCRLARAGRRQRPGPPGHARRAPRHASPLLPGRRSIAFLSDRRPLVEDEPEAPKDREDGTQVHLLPLAGGEARRLTDLPRGVDDFEWSPDGRSLVVRTTSSARRAPRTARPAEGRAAEARRDAALRLPYFDRLQGMLNGPAHRRQGGPPVARRRRDRGGEPPDRRPRPRTRSRPGPRRDPDRLHGLAGRDHDLDYQFDVFVVEVATKRVTRITDGAGCVFGTPTWLADGATLAVTGHRLPRAAAAATTSGSSPRMARTPIGAGAATSPGTATSCSPAGWAATSPRARRPACRDAGRPPPPVHRAVRGSYELWRIALPTGPWSA